MMGKIFDRGVEVGTRARRRLIANAAEEYRKLLPGAVVTESMNGLEVTGRDLLRRWLRNAELRFIAGRMR